MVTQRHSWECPCPLKLASSAPSSFVPSACLLASSPTTSGAAASGRRTLSAAPCSSRRKPQLKSLPKPPSPPTHPKNHSLRRTSRRVRPSRVNLNPRAGKRALLPSGSDGSSRSKYSTLLYSFLSVPVSAFSIRLQCFPSCFLKS